MIDYYIINALMIVFVIVISSTKKVIFIVELVAPSYR